MQAACEVESATSSMCLRTFPEASSARDATHMLRRGWLEAIRCHHLAHSGGRQVASILDVGCSVGLSTEQLADFYPQAEVTVSGGNPYGQ